MDKKAKNILFKTYWSARGWKSDKVTDPLDFDYAKADRLDLNHDQCVNDVLALRERISAAKAARAFLSSLASRRLDWRSGLASFSLAQQTCAFPRFKSVIARLVEPELGHFLRHA